MLTLPHNQLEQRMLRLLAHLDVVEFMSTTDIAALLHISPISARKYIRQLAAKKLVSRIRNGCRAIKNRSDQSWNLLNIESSNNYKEKTRIVQAQLVCAVQEIQLFLIVVLQLFCWGKKLLIKMFI